MAPNRDALSASDAQTLYDYLRMRGAASSSPGPADAILVLGSNDIRVAACAAELFRNGVAPLVVFSGARGNFTESLDTTEAEWLAKASGLPDDAILLEPTATNTGENIVRCRELLAGRFGGTEEADRRRYVGGGRGEADERSGGGGERGRRHGREGGEGGLGRVREEGGR